MSIVALKRAWQIGGEITVNGNFRHCAQCTFSTHWSVVTFGYGSSRQLNRLTGVGKRKKVDSFELLRCKQHANADLLAEKKKEEEVQFALKQCTHLQKKAVQPIELAAWLAR